MKTKSQAGRPSEKTGSPAKEQKLFDCGFCGFSTESKTSFKTHVEGEHRKDLSLWCKNCEKYFSCASSLITHIEEEECEKQERVYRCGTQKCDFEDPSGLSFAQHLRLCKGNGAFIFCVHCTKMFTMTHCLILHMQNECPYKERNLKYPEQASSETSALDDGNNNDTIPVAKPKGGRGRGRVASKRGGTSRSKDEIPSSGKASNKSKNEAPSRGRGRVTSRRGRRGVSGGRSAVAEESDSDVDDPLVTPEETGTSGSATSVTEASKRIKLSGGRSTNDANDPGSGSRRQGLRNRSGGEKNYK